MNYFSIDSIFLFTSMQTNLATKIHFLIVNQKKKTRIPTSSIIMLEGLANYTLIHLQNGKQKLYARTLRHFEELLSEEHFIRVHRGFLVNSSCIINYDKEENILRLENNLEVSISRRKRGCLEGYC
jgi:DNA-binding LytR/AlgR family response regulator